MKNILFIIAILLSINSFGQETVTNKNSIYKKNGEIQTRKIRTYVLEYDFQTGLFPNGKKIKPRVNEPLVFKIKNINRLAYSVNITAKDSSIAISGIPEQFELYKKKEIMDTKDALVTATTPTPSPDINIEKSDLLDQNIKINVDQLNNIISTSAQNLDGKSTSDILRSTQFDTISGISTLIDVQRRITILYDAIFSKNDQLNSLLGDYLYVETTINDPLLTQAQYQNNNKPKIDSIKNRLDSNKNVYSEFNTLVHQFNSGYKILKSNNELAKTFNYRGIVKLSSYADNQNQDIEELNEIVKKLDFKKIRSDLEQATRLFEDESLFEYTSLPIQPIQDVAIFKVSIVKKEKENSLFDNDRTFTRGIFTKHGIRLDASIGIAGSFFPNATKYELQFNNKDQNQIAKIDENQFNPSFVGLFTTSYRSSSHFSGGLSLGLGLNADDGKLIIDNFYVGPSLIIGKYERMSITTGGTFKNIPTLNDSFQVGQTVPNSYNLNNITTESYKFGFFIAISYNLTKGVKDQLKFLK